MPKNFGVSSSNRRGGSDERESSRLKEKLKDVCEAERRKETSDEGDSIRTKIGDRVEYSVKLTTSRPLTKKRRFSSVKTIIGNAGCKTKS